LGFFKLNIQKCSLTDFIVFWSKCYNESEGKYTDADYEKNLNRQGLLTPENIQYLLEWKNANRLSKAKQKVADGIKERVAKLNEFRQLPTVSDKEFKKFWSLISSLIEYGVVWKVFLLHISRPNDYPIFDQHVLRAWNFLTKQRVEELDKNLENYKEYKSFFLKLEKQYQGNMRDVDRALMAFGQFLQSQFFLDRESNNTQRT
jgi:hypothetical protein